MLNICTIQGRLTKAPELKTTNSGKPVCSFSVAVDRRFDRDKTDFFTIVAWNKTAEFVSNYFHKGEMILVSGELQTRTYEKDGRNVTVTEIIANTVDFCGGKNETKGESNPVSVEVDEMPF